jgi:iron(III) transport system ATP-binding protein
VSGLTITDLYKSFGAQPVLAGLNMAAPAGSFTAILGSSGSGKTTLLRILAGFERPDRGTIMIGERVVEADNHHVRPEQRHIGYVPQEGSLFPHLTVEANIGFGLARKERRRRVVELLDLVGLAGLERRYPHQLSGGQQQRVALARALAVRPEIVLLDEPFASLDTHLRVSVREEVKTILRKAGTTSVLVTHDQDEALSLADLIAVLRDGVIAQYATPHDIYTAPVDDELAQFIGDANLVPGTLDGAFVDTPLGRLPALWDGDPPATPCAVTVLLRPEQILVQTGHTNGGLGGTIADAGYHGHDTIIHIETDPTQHGQRLVARTPADIKLKPGAPVTITVHGPVHVWPCPARETSAEGNGADRALPLASGGEPR